MVQPMDDLLPPPAWKGAGELISDMLPTLRAASTHDGKFWGIPYSFENISFNWRTDYFDAVGATAAPTSSAGLAGVARALKEWGADQQIMPDFIYRRPGRFGGLADLWIAG